MRAIKFRAWDIEEKCWIPQEVLAIATEDGRVLTYEEGEDRWCEETISIALIQFTGVCDKTGIEIYEGDIVRCHVNMCNIHKASVAPDYEAKPLGIVVFDEQNACFFVESVDGKAHDFICNVEPEIVGNIHENSELLSRKDVEI